MTRAQRKGNGHLRDLGQLNVQVTIKHGEIGHDKADHKAHQNAQKKDQKGGVNESGQNFFAKTAADFLIRKILRQHLIQAAAALPRADRGRIELGKATRLLKSDRKESTGT